MIAIMDKISDWLNSELNERGWSQRELARRARVSPTAINDVINEKAEPGWDLCAAIAKALGLSEEEVFRMAGLLPPLPNPNQGVSYDQLWEVVKHLPSEERQEVYKYAQYRLQQQQEQKKRRKQGNLDETGDGA